MDWKEKNAKTDAMIQRLVMQSKIMKMREEQDALEQRMKIEAALEEIYRRGEELGLEQRYNHYHDPRTGQFASGKGGGVGDNAPIYMGHGDSAKQLHEDFNKYGYAAYDARQSDAKKLQDIVNTLRLGNSYDFGYKNEYGRSVKALPGQLEYWENAMKIRKRIDAQDKIHTKNAKQQKAINNELKTAMKYGQMSFL